MPRHMGTLIDDSARGRLQIMEFGVQSCVTISLPLLFAGSHASQLLWDLMDPLWMLALCNAVWMRLNRIDLSSQGSCLLGRQTHRQIVIFTQ